MDSSSGDSATADAVARLLAAAASLGTTRKPPPASTPPAAPLSVKVISMGDAACGKSCLIKRYCERRFVPKYLSTIGIDYGLGTFPHAKSGRSVSVHFFDAAGRDLYASVRREFYAGVHGALLVFDVAARDSFEHLGTWLDELRDYWEPEAAPTPSPAPSPAQSPAPTHRRPAPAAQQPPRQVVVVVCGNKTDQMRRTVTEAEARLWAEHRGLLYFETSAQTGVGVDDTFAALVDELVAAATGVRVARPVPAFTGEQVEAVRRVNTATDDYDVLGVPRAATADDIRRAYRRLAVLLHPDKSGAPGSEEAFKRINAAKKALLKGAD
jgi:DnaJ homolog subfamily C member 27